MVATALTVYGIETNIVAEYGSDHGNVATALTVYGIETSRYLLRVLHQTFCVATALTVYGIETCLPSFLLLDYGIVATALTVYGIETSTRFLIVSKPIILALQQHLPFTVLKRQK